MDLTFEILWSLWKVILPTAQENEIMKEINFVQFEDFSENSNWYANLT